MKLIQFSVLCRRGACPKLHEMSHEELLSDYLGPLRFQHNGPGSRSMRGLTGGKLRSDSTSRLSGSVVGLYGILPERGNNTVSVRQVGGHSAYQYVGELG